MADGLIKNLTISTTYRLKSYSDHQRQNWAKSKSIVIYENETQLRSFVQDAILKKNLGKKMYLGAVSKELSQRIKIDTGIDVEDYNCTLWADDVRHTLKKHGNMKTEELRGQRVITVDDFVNIPKIIQEYDNISYDSKNMEKPALLFVKTLNGCTTVVANISKGHLDLRVKSMRSGKNNSGNLAMLVNAKSLT